MNSPTAATTVQRTVWSRHEEHGRQGDQPKAQSSEKERRKRLETDLDDDEIHRPANGNNER